MRERCGTGMVKQVMTGDGESDVRLMESEQWAGGGVESMGRKKVTGSEMSDGKGRGRMGRKAKTLTPP